MVEIKILGRYRDQVAATCQVALATGKSRGRSSPGQNQHCRGAMSRAGATLGAKNCSPTIRDWGFGGLGDAVNIQCSTKIQLKATYTSTKGPPQGTLFSYIRPYRRYTIRRSYFTLYDFFKTFVRMHA